MEIVKTVIAISEKDTRGLGAFYRILSANDTADGLKLIEANAENVSLILIDIDIAIKNNAEIIKEISEKQHEKSTPIVVIASGDCEDNKLKCFEAGATDFIDIAENVGIIHKRLENIITAAEIALTHYRVSKDPLTDCYNKPFFMEYMTQRLKNNPDKLYDLVCLELESYELLHGRYGVEICNVFMGTMARSLCTFLANDVIMGRIDDAHVVFMIQHIPFEFHEQMMQGCVKMSEGSPFPFFVINAGVYTQIDPTLTAEEIYKNCLLAIEGIRYNPNRFIAEYTDEIHQRKQRLRMLEANMYKALNEHHFQVYYQPKYCSTGEKIHGAEALVRWIDPELGFMSPGDFIPLFEKNGFIFELDKYILEKVCIDLRTWLDSGMEIVPVSVNVSQTDFDQTALDNILESIVDKYNIPHEYIHFELTETADAPDALKKSIAVSGFRKKGFRVELDDFGAGYSTLSILKNMPVDVMKIDMSLVRHMFEPNCKAILEGAFFTAKQLDIKVVVEGVENDEQYNALKEMGKQYVEPDIQGYYFSRPLPHDDFEAKLKAN